MKHLSGTSGPWYKTCIYYIWYHWPLVFEDIDSWLKDNPEV